MCRVRLSLWSDLVSFSPMALKVWGEALNTCGEILYHKLGMNSLCVKRRSAGCRKWPVDVVELRDKPDITVISSGMS